MGLREMYSVTVIHDLRLNSAHHMTYSLLQQAAAAASDGIREQIYVRESIHLLWCILIDTSQRHGPMTCVSKQFRGHVLGW